MFRTQTAHGFSIGDVVAPDGMGGWALADATASGAVIVVEVLDVDTFRVDVNGCITGLTGVFAGTDYAVSNTTPGDIVDINTLDPDNDDFRVVGISPEDGCLLVNVTPLVAVSGTPPVGGTVIFTEDNEGGAPCGFETPIGPFGGGGGETFASPGVDSTCHVQGLISGITDGTPFLNKQCIVPPEPCLKACTAFAVVEAAPGDAAGIGFTNIFYLMAADAFGSADSSFIRVRYDSSNGFWMTISDFGATIPPLTDIPGTAVLATPNNWYYLCLEAQVNSALGANDGSITWSVYDLAGTIAGGATIPGTLPAPLYTNTFSGIDISTNGDPFNLIRVSGSYTSGGLTAGTRGGAWGAYSLRIC